MLETTKQCIVCKQIKPVTSLIKDKRMVGGIGSYCIPCSNEKSKLYIKTKKGLTNLIYQNQKKNSKKRGRVVPDYNLVEFREWIYTQPHFESLYDEWVYSGYMKHLTPSVDRIDNEEPYTFGNIQLMTWQENDDKGSKDHKECIKVYDQTPVIQLSMDGEYLQEFPSMCMAARETSISQGHISGVCNNKYGRKSAGGYKWAFKTMVQSTHET